MKAFSSSLLPWLAFVGYAAAQDAYLYNLDVQPRLASSSKTSSIDSETANGVIARRLGATELLKLGTVDDTKLENLDRYGGQRTLSFFEDGPGSFISDRLILAIEGYNGTHEIYNCCSGHYLLMLLRRVAARLAHCQNRETRHESCECTLYEEYDLSRQQQVV